MSIDERTLTLNRRYRRHARRDYSPAILGDALGNIIDPNQPGYVYARVKTSNGLSSPRSVLLPANTPIQLTPGAPVKLGYDELDRLIILGGDTNQTLATGQNTAAAIQQQNSPRITQDSIETLAAIPTSPASLSLNVKAWQPIVNNIYYEFPGATIDLSIANAGGTFVPSAGNMRYVVIFVKNDYATLEAKGSTARPVTDLVLDAADVNECLNAKSTGSTPVCAVKLIGGQTAITQSDIAVDGKTLRQMVNTSASASVGTVTSVGLTMPSEFSVAGSPITAAGTLAVSKATQAANLIYAGPTSGGAAVPTFRALVAADIPSGGGSPLTTKGDLYGFSTVNARLPVGANNQFLAADSTQTLGLLYRAITSSDLTAALTTPPAIGGTTPAAGTFNALTVTNTSITPLIEATNGAAILLMDSYVGSASGSFLISRKARGTKASPTAVLAADILGENGYRGYNGSAFSGDQAVFYALAAENWSVSAMGTQWIVGLTQIGTTTIYGALTVHPIVLSYYGQDAATAATIAVAFGHNSSGTPAAGFGVDLTIQSQDSVNINRNMALIRTTWLTATSGSQIPEMDFYLIDNAGFRLALSLATSGGAAKIGFLGTAPVVRQTDGAALTNNVTAGGTTDTIANYTDLLIYANDAAAIRNDIYQLARKIKIVDDALRAYGLLT